MSAPVRSDDPFGHRQVRAADEGAMLLHQRVEGAVAQPDGAVVLGHRLVTARLEDVYQAAISGFVFGELLADVVGDVVQRPGSGFSPEALEGRRENLGGAFVVPFRAARSKNLARRASRRVPVVRHRDRAGR